VVPEGAGDPGSSLMNALAPLIRPHRQVLPSFGSHQDAAVWQSHPDASIKQYIDAGQIADVSSTYQRDNLSSAIRQDLRQAVS